MFKEVTQGKTLLGPRLLRTPDRHLAARGVDEVLEEELARYNGLVALLHVVPSKPCPDSVAVVWAFLLESKADEAGRRNKAGGLVAVRRETQLRRKDERRGGEGGRVRTYSFHEFSARLRSSLVESAIRRLGKFGSAWRRSRSDVASEVLASVKRDLPVGGRPISRFRRRQRVEDTQRARNAGRRRAAHEIGSTRCEVEDLARWEERDHQSFKGA